MILQNQLAAQYLRQRILQLARLHNWDSGTVAEGLADTLATIAVVLDKEKGEQSLQGRLHSFCARVEQTYKRMKAIKESSKE